MTQAAGGLRARLGGAAATPAPACAHCGASVPAGLVDARAQEQFCCEGCRTARAVIAGCGLDRYYALREASGESGAPSRATGRRYQEFDDPAFASLYIRDAAPGLKSVELLLEGVHCAACVWLVERLPSVVPGVIEARLDLRRSIVVVTWDPARTPLSNAARGLDRLGYPPHPARHDRARQLRAMEDRRWLGRLAVAGACAGNVMLLAIALYAGMFTGIEAAHRDLFHWWSMALTLIAVAWPGRVFFRGAVAALRTRTPHLDVPIATGLLAGVVWSSISTVRGHEGVYFDSLSVLVFLLLVGRYFQHRQQRWAADSVEMLFALTPGVANVIDEDTGEVREAPVEGVDEGCLVLVRAGDSVPVDGVVEQGRSDVDQSLLTGESHPSGVAEGDEVCAGTVNLTAPLRVRVRAAGESTRVAQLMRSVEEASRRRAPIVQTADRIAGRFVIVVLTLALATALAWAFIDPAHAIDHAAALLIVTCPCALGLATPLAVTVAIGRAARRGIVIKGGDALERLSRPGRIFLDKTGTLTEGSVEVVEWHGDRRLRGPVALLEASSSHPIAKALARFGDDGLQDAAVSEVVQTIGGGLAGTVGGVRLIVGSPAFVRSMAGPAPAEADLDRAVERMLERGLTPVLVAADGRIGAAAALGDPLRPGAREVVESLRQHGWRVSLLSGDHPRVVSAAAERVGIDHDDALGSQSPEQKFTQISRAATHGPVVMVGDGVNDAAALAAAGVGIAVHGGAEASLAAADVYLSREGILPVAELVEGARRTIRTIRRCMAASLAYNAVAAGLAMGGLISPLLAAILMPISSLTVLTLAVRSRTFGKAGVRREGGPTCP